MENSGCQVENYLVSLIRDDGVMNVLAQSYLNRLNTLAISNLKKTEKYFCDDVMMSAL